MLVKGRTSAYTQYPDGRWHVTIPNFDTYGATSLFTTVGDPLKWQENFRRPVVGDEALLREMQQSAVLTNGDTTGYGLGLTIGQQRGMLLVGHGGADAGYRSYTGRYPEHGFAIAVLCNAAAADPGGLAANVSARFLRRFAKPVPAPVVATAKPSKDELSRLAGVYVNPVTRNVTFLSLKDSSLIVGRTTGPALVPIGPRRFWFAPQQAEWQFAPNGDLVVTFKGTPPRQPVTLVKREAARPSRSDLAAYAGTYSSPELGALYVVSASDTALKVRTGVNDPWVATPAYGDTFLGRGIVEFTRDQSGRLTGFHISTGRVRRVRFDKTQ